MSLNKNIIVRSLANIFRLKKNEIQHYCSDGGIEITPTRAKGISMVGEYTQQKLCKDEELEALIRGLLKNFPLEKDKDPAIQHASPVLLALIRKMCENGETTAIKEIKATIAKYLG